MTVAARWLIAVRRGSRGHSMNEVAHGCWHWMSSLGHELAGVVTAPGYGTTRLSVGRRVFGADHGEDDHPRSSVRDGDAGQRRVLRDGVRLSGNPETVVACGNLAPP